MNNRKIIYWGLAFLFVTSLILGGVVFFLGNAGKFKVAFLDVGQGDSILISSGSKQMLVDGGENEKVLLEKLGRHIPFWDRKIEVLVLTHTDKDHLGGLLSVLQNYEVKTIVVTDYESKTKVQDVWEKLIEKEGATVIDAVAGTKIKISEGLFADVLYPFYFIDVSEEKKSNDYSVVMKILAGQKSFLLMGDVSKSQENEMMENGVSLGADVLKVGHHGSKNSTGKNFLKAADPEDAVISSGKDNRYGHPHQETINALKNDSVEIFRTDESGDVVYECDEKECFLVE